MKGVELIVHKSKTLALVVRKGVPVSGIKFLTNELNPFQIGIHERKKGISLIPHVHVMDSPITITSIQEVLMVQKGKIRLSLYTKKGVVITKKILKTGDSVLLIEGGHGVDFLADSRIFEIKQGPHHGVTHAKIHVKSST